MSRNELDSLTSACINTLLCVLIAIIWTYVLIIPGLILIDIITNSNIYRSIYIVTMTGVGGYLTAFIIAKGLLTKLLIKKK